MLRKKKSEGTARRARLDIVNADTDSADDSTSDPIAAALEERKKKQGVRARRTGCHSQGVLLIVNRPIQIDVVLWKA